MDLDLIKALGLEELLQSLRSQVSLVWQVVRQSRLRYKGTHIANKIYSLNEPQVSPEGYHYNFFRFWVQISLFLPTHSAEEPKILVRCKIC